MKQGLDYEAMRLPGRCRDGAERGSGFLTHALRMNEWKALCGQKAGSSSVGWVLSVEAVNCPRCVSRLNKLG